MSYLLTVYLTGLVISFFVFLSDGLFNPALTADVFSAFVGSLGWPVVTPYYIYSRFTTPKP